MNRKGNPPGNRAIRLGLCCQFRDEPIRFRAATATALLRWPKKERLRRLAELCAANADALYEALRYCAAHGIGSFRIGSSIMPVKTHPTAGYDAAELPGAEDVVARFRRCGAFAREHGIRTGFHPDQFVVLNSPDEEIVQRSIRDLESQAEIAEWTHADTINIHGGGGYGDKPAALDRFRRNLDRLSPRARRRVTVENDDRVFTPSDLYPVCRADGIPLVYDAHHHRCLNDGWTVGEATERARETWNREPLFHISSPIHGWRGPHPERHHDFIQPRDIPSVWLDLSLTVEVEAKAKEQAVLRLRHWLDRKSAR
ncbi:MAG: UV DNA damage repair endonuclease UvsE [Kiritimatiellae bacterium]|nr:UV DNA damage repair endonuclease UvsE [Kiritimatiellia bacterium]